MTGLANTEGKLVDWQVGQVKEGMVSNERKKKLLVLKDDVQDHSDSKFEPLLEAALWKK